MVKPIGKQSRERCRLRDFAFALALYYLSWECVAGFVYGGLGIARCGSGVTITASRPIAATTGASSES